MRSARAFVLGLFTVLAATNPPAQAQFKFADLNPPLATKDITFQNAKAMDDLKHGTLVSVDLNDGSNVKGHVVRFDKKANVLFVRTKSGNTPLAIAEDGIKAIKKATRQVGNTSANLVEPEIMKQVIYNGAQQSVTYFTSGVSPQERAVDQLQRAENTVLALEHQNSRREIAMAQEMSMQDERLTTQQLINATMRNENSDNYPYPPATLYTAGLPTRQRKGVITLVPHLKPLVGGTAELVQPGDAQALPKAQAELARLQSQAVYEDGRLVAVLVK